ncbi:bifunctional 3-(3-hydroxy-phenyl)propionate/3-hydroxycinnamic acid hydroxylase [Zobellella endophytica]|uniref:3-(3-hydroxy-phenyl)propionate/3-hydroxycinnamic acid hydroxylase n=1 Tax=Zobellella endophytica TaxID=2116700 RepID=A0A2P7R1M3_9GAMM|nr:bifunctional 3-(3-hydroxy-phenyl)propionate/3-hydroxycinnamic acid hydroxylase [Zobellella endophytica]PSJ44105.1 bifunctional 3-(3-hydroxy-phenyl)propionate/3-hydroxycinnamic acid hydroxylase [Zobellella endophytica]
MTATTLTTPGPDARFDADVVIAGAGPVGLMIANYLGHCGVEVVVVEKLDTLIDYPRAIGLDDESLRTFQAVELAEQVLPHTTPMHAMRFLTPKGRCFADIQPNTDEFGWPRRNAFIQPLADRVLYEGLARFDKVKVLFSRDLQAFGQDGEGVSLTLAGPEGEERLRARYLVACDGGNSLVRRTLDISFEGKTAPNQWIVIDVRNDPLGTPNIYMCCDAERPYVSAALPHGIRRFEFMVMPGETEEQLSRPEELQRLLAKVLPDPTRVDVIRQRVYTHNARLAGEFRRGRILLAGDAAHIMPVWQGQGYNSGMRDASNLAWKLALVVQGLAGDELLDSYQQERRDHARAMIDLSVTAGHVLAPPKKWQASLRDGISWLLNYIPPVKRYFLEMRFKPMPQYRQGVLVEPTPKLKPSPVGKLFIQPRVRLGEQVLLLDEVIGRRFAVIAWGTDPTYGLSAEELAHWRRLGTCFIQVVPSVQLQAEARLAEGVIRIGDESGRLKEWFGRYPASIAVLRPDRFVAGIAIPQTLELLCRQLRQALKAKAQPQQAPAAARKVA